MRRLRFARTPSGAVGLALLAGVVALALLGPLLAPNAPDEPVGIPLTGPTDGLPLGTDFLGRDVLSRVLWGGRSVLALAGAATLLAYLIAHQGEILHPHNLLKDVWQYHDSAGASTLVRAHVSNLRRKVRQVHGSADQIQTIRGKGYRFSA